MNDSAMLAAGGFDPDAARHLPVCTVSRDGPGAYRVMYKERTVSIVRNDMLPARQGQWIACAGWDRHLVTDPAMTLREAVRNARYMLHAREDVNAEYGKRFNPAWRMRP